MKANLLPLFWDIIAVYYENRIREMIIVSGQNAELFNVEAGGGSVNEHIG
jgi:hypothetical protein